LAPLKLTGHNGRYPPAVGRLNADLITDVREHIVMAHINQRKLAEIGVRWEVFKRVELL